MMEKVEAEANLALELSCYHGAAPLEQHIITAQHAHQQNHSISALKPTIEVAHKAANLSGKITEIITSDKQEESLAMLLPLLATLSKDDRWFAWVSPPKNLPKSLLLQAGIALDKVMLLYPDENHTALGIAAKALSAGTCHAVISWSGVISEHEFSQLQQSAQTGASHAILIRSRYS